MQSITDLLSAPKTQPQSKPATKDKALDEATRSIVGSVFYGTLMKTMRESGMKGKYGHGGRGEEAFGAQLDGMLAERAGQGTQGGLADALYKHLERSQKSAEAIKKISQMGGAR